MSSKISRKSNGLNKKSFHQTMDTRKRGTISKKTRSQFKTNQSFSKTLPKKGIRESANSGGILNLGDLGPITGKPVENKKKGLVYSKNKVSAIVNRIKSPIVVNSQQTYYLTRFSEFEKGIDLYTARQQQTRAVIVSDLDAIRLKFQELRKKVEASRSHKKDLVDSLKALKLTKAKFAKVNNHKANLMEKDEKKQKKQTTAKVNNLRKDLNIIRIDGEQRLHKLTNKVQSLLSELRNDDKSKLVRKGPGKDKKMSAQKVQKTCLAYVKKAKLLIKDHKSKLNLDFENTLKMHRNNILIKLSSHLEDVRKDRRNHHYKLQEFAHNTDSKVMAMLREKKIQLNY